MSAFRQDLTVRFWRKADFGLLLTRAANDPPVKFSFTERSLMTDQDGGHLMLTECSDCDRDLREAEGIVGDEVAVCADCLARMMTMFRHSSRAKFERAVYSARKHSAATSAGTVTIVSDRGTLVLA
jgi:DNA-directed RNA polymerase subunit RPC12/RpoP